MATATPDEPATTEPDDTPLVTTRTVAAATGLSERTVRNYAASGRIPSTVTGGGHRRFDLEAVRRALVATGEPADPPSLGLLRRRRRAIDACARRHGADHVRVFGSVATGTADAGSDIDLLVALAPDRTYADVEDLRADLEQLLGYPVDVLTEGACHGRLADVPDHAIAL